MWRRSTTPLQLVLAADRNLHGDAAVGELRAHLLEHGEEVRPLAIEHVDEDDARDAELARSAPTRARSGPRRRRRRSRRRPRPRRPGAAAMVSAWKPASPGVSIRFSLTPLPLEVAERRGQRHLPPVLVLVPVRDRRALLDRPEPVRRARLEQQRLDQRRLAGPAVADDGDVADCARLGHGQQVPPRVLGARGV